VKTEIPGLSCWTPHHMIQHLFVIPTADYAAKLLLRMGKEWPKHAEFLNFYNKPIYCDIKLDTYTYFNTMHGTMNLKK
jgi:hypothetical protein